MQQYPLSRPRRTRQSDWSRRLVAEHTLTPNDLIWPIFVHDGNPKEDVPIASMPGVFRYGLKSIPKVIDQAYQLGIPAVAIFPHVDPSKKNAQGTEAFNASNIVCQAIEAAKNENPDVGIICDVALDPFTDHGHDGLIDPETGEVLNDETIDVLIKQALVQVKAGCDIIAPSDMMDGRVGAIRKALEAGFFTDVQIMSYAAKYASGFYGPFRDAVGSADLTGQDKKLGFRDKQGYQMDPANSEEALREVTLDISEGADSVMVKPGMPYLDILQRVSSETGFPTFVYQVSGEYNMIKNSVDRGDLHEKVILESLLAFKRAGASGIFTYFAPFIAEKLNK